MRCPALHELPPPPKGKSGWPWTQASPPFAADLTPDHTGAAEWPKMTVVTPAYNGAAFLEATIRSVLLQGYPNLEYIVIDGGSKDGTVEIIRRYAPWLTYWCSEPDRGQSHALNKGFAQSTGDWLAWLNADDLYLPNALSAVAATARRRPETDWIIGVLRWIDEHGADLGTTVPTPFTAVTNPAQWGGRRWLAQVCFRGSGLFCPQPVSFWSRRAHETVGPLDETLHYSMDLDRWGKLAYYHFEPTLIDAELAGFRLHAAQKSGGGEARFMVDDLAIVDHWLPKVSGEERQILANYRTWLAQALAVERLHSQVAERQQRWQRLMRNQAFHATFALAKNILNSTHFLRLVLAQLNKRRPAWMYFYG